MLLLVPSDPLNPRKVDPHFQPQAAAAAQVARIDHDAVVRGEYAEAVRGVPSSEDAVYRGWMMTSGQYDGMARALATRGTTLRTSSEDYRQAHELPGWYDALAGVTPLSAWGPPEDLDALCDRLGDGPAVLRDYVKSMKHYWHEAAYIPDLADRPAVRRVVSRFLELRDDSFAGGLVLRQFEAFAGAEARTWWIGGRCVLVTAHPDTPDETPQFDVLELEPLVAGLTLPFVTVDLVRRTDGVMRVVELGDGQVSDWPVSADPALLVAALEA
ncbi:ATP-grasp domain-containing protein [Kribbella deserti]|uniref:ATP-grasp domain-containing protein n=1 Tax=Kribbella deserti TaxID=1926257 RepID=A0ABV6QQ93_9ACTN